MNNEEFARLYNANYDALTDLENKTFNEECEKRNYINPHLFTNNKLNKDYYNLPHMFATSKGISIWSESALKDITLDIESKDYQFLKKEYK